MPRQIDLQCQQCGFVEEVQKEINFFETEEPTSPPCPKCGYAYRDELPALVNLHTVNMNPPPKVPKKPPRLAPEGIMPEEIRRAFAKELFDPCSCGEHAPADLDEHDETCHNRLHSFVIRKEEKQPTERV